MSFLRAGKLSPILQWLELVLLFLGHQRKGLQRLWLWWWEWEGLHLWWGERIGLYKGEWCGLCQ